MNIKFQTLIIFRSGRDPVCSKAEARDTTTKANIIDIIILKVYEFYDLLDHLGMDQYIR